jgi:hypothetical protein
MDTHSCTAASCAVGCGVHCAILSGVQTISFVVPRQPCWLSPCICKLVAAAEDLRANMHRAHSVPFGGVVVLASPCVYFAFAFLVVRLAPCSLHQGASLQTCTVLIACLLGVLDGCVCFTRCVPCPCYASSSPGTLLPAPRSAPVQTCTVLTVCLLMGVVASPTPFVYFAFARPVVHLAAAPCTKAVLTSHP